MGYIYTGICKNCNKEIKSRTREELDDKFSKHNELNHLEILADGNSMIIKREKQNA